MKNNSLSLIFLVTVFFLYGCDNKTYTIPKGDRPFFRTGDTLLFKDPFGNTDTLVVTVIQGFQQHDKGDSYEYFVIRYQLMKNKIIDTNDLLHVTQYIEGAAVSSKGVPFITERSIDRMPLRDGNIVKNVAEFERSPQKIKYPDIALIYHNPHFGIVKYQYYNGEFFELVLP